MNPYCILMLIWLVYSFFFLFHPDLCISFLFSECKPQIGFKGQGLLELSILLQEIETPFPFELKKKEVVTLLFSVAALVTSRNLWVWVALVQKTAMHRLRTCAARLRPITASQTAKNLSQQRPVATPRTFQPFRCYTAPVAAEPFLNGTSSNYVEEMYYAWLENPKSVHKVRGKGHAGGLWEEGMKRSLFQWSCPPDSSQFPFIYF